MRLRRYFLRRPIVPRPMVPASESPPPALPVSLPVATPVIVRKDPPHQAFPFHRVHHHRPGVPVRKPLAGRLALLLAVLINALSLAVLGGGLYVRFGPAKSSENNLRSEHNDHKLKETSASTAAVPEAAPFESPEPELEEPPTIPPPVRPEPEIALPKVSEPPALVSVPEPPLGEPPVVSTTSASAAAPVQTPPPGEDLWQPCLVYTRNPGETPMLRTWKMLKLASVMSAALAVTPVAFAQEKDDIKSVLERLNKMDDGLKAEFKNIKSSFDKIDGEIRKIKGDLLAQDVDVTTGKRSLEELEKQVEKLARTVDGIKKKLPAEGSVAFYQGGDKGLEEIRQRLDQIEKLLLKLQPTQQRTAFSPPNLGRIVMVNLYPEELLFRVNGQNVRVPPGASRVLEGVPAGPLNYEVISPMWGLRAAKNTSLNPSETFTLTAQ